MTLSQLSAGLLFLHGHIADPALAATLAASAERTSPTFPSRSVAMDLFKSLMYLGGRPMHPGYNFDLDEPFEAEFGNRIATERLFGRTRSNAAAERRGPQWQAPDACVQGCG